MSSGFHNHYRTPRTRDYVLTLLDNTGDVVITVFDFCVRNYKRHCQPVVYPIYKSTTDYVVTWIDPGYWEIKNKYF